MSLFFFTHMTERMLCTMAHIQLMNIFLPSSHFSQVLSSSDDSDHKNKLSIIKHCLSRLLTPI